MTVRFIKSAAAPLDLGDHGLPEFGIIGRSNVGKSSLLGRLFKQPKIVRTSNTPGRTQLLNLFIFEEALALVDLPGYGYAKLPKDARARLQRMISNYLQYRHALTGVVLLLDARREKPTQDDREIAEWVREMGRPLLLVATKIDLIPKNKRINQLRKIEKAIGVPPNSALPFSAHSGDGRGELVARLFELAEQ